MFELPVYRNADRLKRLFTGIFHATHLLRHAAFDKLCQFQRGMNGLFGSGTDDIAGNAAGKRFLPVGIENTGKFLLRSRIDQIFRRHAGLAHTHIQGCIVMIGKTAGLLVQLVGRNSQIQQHAVHRHLAHLRQHLCHFIIIVVHHRCRIRCQPLRCNFHSIRVAVKTDQFSACRQTLCNFRGMSGSAYGSVHINAVRTNCQFLQHLMQQHGNMYKIHKLLLKSDFF